MNDPIQILYEFLTVPGTGLCNLVGDRIWCPISPPGFDNTAAALIYHPDGETPEAPSNVMANSIVFKCYGGLATFTSSREVASALYDRLHRARAQTATGEIMMARCKNMYQGGADPDTGWPFHVAIYEIVTQ